MRACYSNALCILSMLECYSALKSNESMLEECYSTKKCTVSNGYMLGECLEV